jgi:hypothetical protein
VRFQRAGIEAVHSQNIRQFATAFQQLVIDRAQLAIGIPRRYLIYPGHSKSFLISEQVEYVAQHTAVCFIKIRVLAVVTGDGRKARTLHVKDLAPEAAGTSNLAGRIVAMTAFWATVVCRHRAMSCHFELLFK